MATTTGPQDLLTTARTTRAAVSAAVATLPPSAGSLGEWAELVGELQAVIDVVTSLQDAAIVALAAVETEVAEDGTLVEVRKPPGHVAVDAPAILSGVLCVSAAQAERRVRDTVRRAADGPEGSRTWTGLGGLHAAMAAGRLDAYRAQVVAHELEEVPAEVAERVVAAVSSWFETEPAPALRRRVRRVLASISPDLLRQRAVRARSECRLERWVDEPGVDTWHGTFPSEEACAAWAAIDELAQRYVADGTCDRVDRARAKALTDLVTQQASVDVRVVVTTPAEGPAPEVVADVLSSAGSSEDLVQVGGLRAGEPVLVPRQWLDDAAVTGRAMLSCDASTGAPVDPSGELAGTGYRPSARLAAFVRARDGHCRFPGCSVAARFCDLDHVRPHPAGPTSAANLACLCRRHHRVKQRPGWRATLHPDATMTWTDPTGRVRTTHPPDVLHPIVLPDTGADPSSGAGNPGTVLPDGPHSTLEHHLEHLAATPARCRVHVVRLPHPMPYVPARVHSRPRRPVRPTDDTPPF